MVSNSVLSTEDLHKAFGGLVVAKGINFSVLPNEVRCIIGPNGAGKTTFFNLLTGLIPIDKGTIRLESDDVTALPVYKRQQMGLVRTFQAPRIFPELTVYDNVLLAYRSKESLFSLMKQSRSMGNATNSVKEALEKINMSKYTETRAGSLSHGEKKRVEMAMAIVQQPKVLLMDEPTAGMTVRETQEIADLVNLIRSEMAVVIVEHDMEFVREIADKITVLYRGDIAREGTLDELENDPFIQEIYLGSVEL
ncbi:ABC transporter ATP-binding protein [Brevibacillus massiliensis]|nr:ABC transporter ATP-binding protein [Brevibacillus massiliensis]